MDTLSLYALRGGSGGGGGNLIDDTTISTTKTWSSSKLNEDIADIGNYLDCSPYSVTTRFADLATALAAVPSAKRKEHALIFFIDNSFNANLYAFQSITLTDDTWFNENYWKKIITKVDLDSFANSISGIINNQSEIINVAGFSEVFDQLSLLAVFNGVSSKCDIEPITLEEDGDSLEIEISTEISTSGNTFYSFAYSNAVGSNIAIGACKTKIAIRAQDETWIASGINIDNKTHYTLKISYQSGNILIYVDNELVHTYTGQKTFTVYGFGKNYYYPYWSGSIGKIKVNGVSYSNIFKLAGYSATNVSLSTNHVFLTDEQNSRLDKILNNVYVVPTSSNVKVYVKVKDNIYVSLTIVHEQNTSDSVYADEWRLAYDYDQYYQYNGTQFVALGKYILVGSENEFAMNFQGMGDFTGGYHGDERIDLDNDCYVEFIADGKAYTIVELVAKGEFWCDSFAYRQRSTLYASYQYNTSHLKLGNHLKCTEFKNGGYNTRNYVLFDLTALGVSTLRVLTAFTGLNCPHKNVAHIITGDDGQKYTATNPSTTVTLVDDINKYSRLVDMQNGDYSCQIDSKLIKTNVTEWQNPTINVDIMDRQNDNKYYSYLPSNVDIETGDYFATECSVFWNKA